MRERHRERERFISISEQFVEDSAFERDRFMSIYERDLIFLPPLKRSTKCSVDSF